MNPYYASNSIQFMPEVILCSDYKAITKITRSMFGLTGMNVVKVEKRTLESGLSAVETAAPRLQPIEKRPVAPRCTE